MMYIGIQLSREKTYFRAKRLMAASIIYLPLIFVFILVDSLVFAN
jgi:heme O synthase-like polyprenyltransferase